VAFEMFTGKLPFQGRNAQEMMIARCAASHRDPHPATDVPDPVEKSAHQGTANESRRPLRDGDRVR